jgi:hypothetical protein
MNHIETNISQMVGVTGASLERAPSRSSVIASASRGATVRKKNAPSAFEQAELWSDSSAQLAAAEVVADQHAPVDAVPFIEIKQLRSVMPVMVKTASRGMGSRQVASTPALVSARKAPSLSIARFLNVNGAIEGMKPTGMRFDLPGRGLSQTLRLWRGTNETATYSSTPL